MSQADSGKDEGGQSVKPEREPDVQIIDGWLGLKPYHATKWDMIMLGVTTVIGGIYYGWTTGLENGFGGYAIGQFLMGLAYICLVLCFAEMTSAMPLRGLLLTSCNFVLVYFTYLFTYYVGGSFAIARVCLGFYGGYIIGAIEFLECILMTALSANYVANAFTTPQNPNYYWVICTMFYSGTCIFISAYVYECIEPNI